MLKQALQPLRLRTRLKVRQQLIIAFSALLILLSVAAYAVTTVLFEASEESLWAGRQRDAASSVAAQTRALIDQAQSALQAVADLSQFAFISNPLQPILQSNPQLTEIAVISPDGRVTARAFRTAEGLFANTDNVNNLEWFAEALETPPSLFWLGELELDEAGAPKLLLALRSANNTIVAAVLNADSLNEIVARVRFGETGVVYIAEAEGPIIAHSDPALRDQLIDLAGRPELPAVEDQKFIGRLGGLEDSLIGRSDYTNIQGDFVLGTTKVVGGTDIVVFVENTQAEIHAGQYRASAIIALVLGLVTLLAILIVQQVVRRGIELPLQRLQEGAERVAQGDLTQQVPISYRDEIGDVTEAFNLMINQLRERTWQKARQDIRLRALYELAASTSDVDVQLNEVLRVGTEMLNVDFGTISRIQGESNTILYAHPADGRVRAGARMPLSQTFCDLTRQANALVSVERMGESPYKDHACYAATGMETYIGVPLTVNGERFGTLSFASKQPRSEPFSASDKDFFLLMGQWVSSLLERQQSEAALLRRDAILAAVSFTAQRLLTQPNWEDDMPQILAQLGETSSASRVYLFQTWLEDGTWLADQRYEWVAEGIEPQIDNPDLQRLNMSELCPRWIDELTEGRPISGLVKDFPASEREILEPRAIFSILILPILVNGQLWGFIGFDECREERSWDAVEVDLLSAAAADLGSAVERQQNEQALMQRDLLLAAVSLSERQLLSLPEWTDALPYILGQLGTALNASRAYVFQKLPDAPPNVTLVEMRCEWTAADIAPLIHFPELRAVPLSELFPDWLENFEAGRPVVLLTKNLQDQTGEILRAQGVVSMASLPILVDGEFWGILGFNEHKGERVWDALELELLATIAADIGAAISRQRQERALRESRERLLQIANSLQGAIYEFFVDEDVWRIGYISQGIYSLAGVTAEEAMADLDNLIRTFHPEDVKPFVDSVNAVLIDKSNWRFEGRLYHKQTGELRWWRAESVPAFEDGHVIFKGVIFDITERRRIEEQVQRQNEALVKANRELAVARRQAEVASKLKSQFLATMSHELRTPLNAIIGYTQLQLAGMVGEMTSEQLAYQDRILVNAQHLLHLINDVLDLSKIEAGRLELAEKPFNVRACLGEVMTQNKVLADSKGLAFTLEVDERLPEVIVGDYGRIKQIIINLVSNAVKFTDHGSVTVKADLADANTWRISVTDTGMGIPPHQQEVIFDEFHQAENGLDRGGTGLGLAIVRKLVLTMRGNIRLNSEVGRGSTFTVTLPLIAEKHATQTLSQIIEG